MILSEGDEPEPLLNPQDFIISFTRFTLISVVIKFTEDSNF